MGFRRIRLWFLYWKPYTPEIPPPQEPKNNILPHLFYTKITGRSLRIMESSHRVRIADLPRRDLTDGYRDSRPTTPVPSKSNPPSGPSVAVAALDLQMQSLESTLDALNKTREGLDRIAVEGSHAGLRVADGLIVAMAQRGTKSTMWQICHPSKYPKKQDLLRRHVGVAQDAYETAGRRYRDVVRSLTELCGKAKSLGDDAKQVGDSIRALSNCKKTILNAEIRIASEMWSRKASKLAAMRKREQQIKMKPKCVRVRQTTMAGRCKTGSEAHSPPCIYGLTSRKHAVGMDDSPKHNAEMLSSLMALTGEIRRVESEEEMLRRNVESLQQLRDAKNQAERVLVAKMVVRWELFEAQLARLSSELHKEKEPLAAVCDKCLHVAARLDTLKESNFGDLVFGLEDLANSVEGQKNRKRCVKTPKMAKAAKRSYASRAGRLLWW
ncbi:hypothetical protein CTA1_9875 [Colletotrichum tanaceti]|uniref:Uncharacterized protein n=1 Tax=Colletotrichum tanaceti TaxID=1306861 RepID=A0A4U6X2M2_9PEZI|nr:hypothetical protein CTA1_9875 [Colletotrichum tanaceti]